MKPLLCPRPSPDNLDRPHHAPATDHLSPAWRIHHPGPPAPRPAASPKATDAPRPWWPKAWCRLMAATRLHKTAQDPAAVGGEPARCPHQRCCPILIWIRFPRQQGLTQATPRHLSNDGDSPQGEKTMPNIYANNPAQNPTPRLLGGCTMPKGAGWRVHPWSTNPLELIDRKRGARELPHCGHRHRHAPTGTATLVCWHQTRR